MTLRFRDDAFVAATATGAHVLTHEGSTTITGASVYAWLERLIPRLDGKRTLRELCAGLPEGHRERAEELVLALQRAGAIEELRREDVPAIGSAKTEHTAEIDFVGYFRPGAGEAFRRYRDTVCRVVGRGDLADAVLGACVRSGVRNVWLVAGPDEVTAGTGLVLYATDRTDDDHGDAVWRAARTVGAAFASAEQVGAEIWLSPLVGSGDAVTWTSIRWRLDSAKKSPEPGPHNEEDRASGPGFVRVAANQFVHRVFQGLTGIRSPDDADVHVVNHLGTQRHRMIAHPFAAYPPTQDQLPARFKLLEQAPRLDEQDFSEQASRCVDPRLGIIAELTERGYAQFPLQVSEAVVRDPVGLTGPVRVTAAALDFTNARHSAALQALATYASLMVDPRRLAPLSGNADADHYPTLDALRAGLRVGHVPGLQLDDRTPCLVDARLVFPALTAERVPAVGVAAGYDWEEAVCNGLLQHCRAVVLGRLTDPHPTLDASAVDLDDAGRSYRELLEAAGPRPCVQDLTGVMGVPAVAVSQAGRAVGVAVGTHLAAALGDALLQALLRRQAEINGEQAYIPRELGPSPVIRKGSRQTAQAERPLSARHIVAALSRHATRIVAVPLDHDAELMNIMPFVVRVVRTR